MNEQSNNNGNINGNQPVNSVMNFGVPSTGVVNNQQQAVALNNAGQPVQSQNGSQMNFNVPNTMGIDNQNQVVNGQATAGGYVNESMNGQMAQGNYNQSNVDSNNAFSNIQNVQQQVQINSTMNNNINGNTQLGLSQQNENIVSMNQPVNNMITNNSSSVNGIPSQPSNNSISGVNNETVQGNVPVSEDLPVNDQVNKKKKISPIVVIAIILVLIVGGVIGYYFLLETPDKIFGTAYNKLVVANSGSTIFDGYAKYNLKLSLNSQNEQYKVYSDIINALEINGTSGYDASSKKFNTVNTILYKNKQLIDFNMLYDMNNNTSYVKLNDVFDKVLMIKSDDNNGDQAVIDRIDTNINDYIALKNAVVASIGKTLENADYKKELAVLNGSRVTKSTLYINKKFIDAYYDSLLGNNDFITSYAKVSQMSIDSIKNDFVNEKNNYKDNNELLVIYTSLIKNDFLKLELLSEDETSISVTQSENDYNYEYREYGDILGSGKVSISKNNDNTNFVATVNLIEEGINLGVNCTYSKASKITELNVSDAVNIDELSDEETNSITTKMMETEAFTLLFKDLGYDQDNLTSLESNI